MTLQVHRTLDISTQPVQLHQSCKQPPSSLADAARQWTLPYNGDQRMNLMHFEAGMTVLAAAALTTMVWRKKALLRQMSLGS